MCHPLQQSHLGLSLDQTAVWQTIHSDGCTRTMTVLKPNFKTRARDAPVRVWKRQAATSAVPAFMKWRVAHPCNQKVCSLSPKPISYHASYLLCLAFTHMFHTDLHGGVLLSSLFQNVLLFAKCRRPETPWAAKNIQSRLDQPTGLPNARTGGAAAHVVVSRSLPGQC